MLSYPSEEISSIIGMPLPFKNGEYKHRIDTVRARMSKENLDILLLYHQESMFYLFGPDQARINNNLILRKNSAQIIEYIYNVNHLSTAV